MQRLLFAVFISTSTALRVSVGANQKSAAPAIFVSRRNFLALPAAALALGGSVAPVSAGTALDEIRVLGSKAKGLKSYVRSTSANRRKFPMEEGGNNYVNVITNLERGKSEVLLPLQAAMAAYVKTATPLSDAELQKALKLQPSFMKGHLLELDTAIKERKFDEYTSKTTGDVYPGGKAERELEEVCDTFSDFLLLASGKPAPQRDGTQ